MSAAKGELWGVLLEAEPDHLGEILREATFTGEGFGCYHTFTVREDATDWTKEMLADFWRRAGFDNADPDHWGDSAETIAGWGAGHTFKLDGYTIDCAWYWDGDGVLYFVVSENGKPVRMLYNSDCKKSYGWYDGAPARVGEAIGKGAV